MSLEWRLFHPAIIERQKLHSQRPPNYNNLGRDMGGCKTYGGWKTYQRTRSPENFWTPPKRAAGLLCRGFLYRKNRALTREGGVENVPYEGGPKPLFGRGVIREVFHPPPFSTPPWRPLNNWEPTAAKWQLSQNLVATAKCSDHEVTSQKLKNRLLSCTIFSVGTKGSTLENGADSW